MSPGWFWHTKQFCHIFSYSERFTAYCETRNFRKQLIFVIFVSRAKLRELVFIGEVLQTEFRFRFRKGPRQISAGPGWSTPEEVEPNFLFCKPNFLFRFGSINSKECVVLVTRCIVMSKNTTEKLNLCLLLDHYSWN